MGTLLLEGLTTSRRYVVVPCLELLQDGLEKAKSLEAAHQSRGGALEHPRGPVDEKGFAQASSYDMI